MTAGKTGQVVRIDVASADVRAIISALFELGGQTLRGMAIFLSVGRSDACSTSRPCS